MISYTPGKVRYLRRSGGYLRIDTDGNGWEQLVVVTGPNDKSPVFQIHLGYDPQCACCWLGHTHSVEAHAVQIKTQGEPHE